MNRFAIFKVRIIQIKRQFEGLGIIYSLLVILALLTTIYVSQVGYSNSSSAWKTTLIIISLILFIHLSRRDLIFVHRQIQYPVQNIFYEYVLLSIPFIITCIFNAQWFHMPILLFAVYIISLIKINQTNKTYCASLSGIVHSTNFEWISGIRKHALYLFVFAGLALTTCWLKIVPLFFLWMFTAIVSSFYFECEPLQLLFASDKKSKQFLKLKVQNHSKLLLAVYCPVLLINSIFHPDAIWIIVLFIIVQLTFLAFAILLKYSVYSPNDNLNHNSVVLSISFIGSIIPFLLPVSFIMCVRNYRKAVKNLDSYFND